MSAMENGDIGRGVLHSVPAAPQEDPAGTAEVFRRSFPGKPHGGSEETTATRNRDPPPLQMMENAGYLREADVASPEEGGGVEGSQPLLVSEAEAGKDSREDVAVEEADLEGSQKDVTYDELLSSLGEFGRHQKRVFFLLSLLNMSAAIQVLISVFTLAVPGHRCALPGMANDTWQIQSEHHALLLNLSLPLSPSYPYDPCHLYHLPSQPHASNDSLKGADGESHSRAEGNGSVSYAYGLDEDVEGEEGTVEGEDREKEVGQGSKGQGRKGTDGKVTCKKYVYDTSTYVSTIATKLDLVCERSLYRSHALMMVMLGNLAGAQTVGCVSDL